MNLNLFKNAINFKKENNSVHNFIKELSEFIGEKRSDMQNMPRKEQSLIQSLLEQNKLTTEYRDKMHVERSHILNDYAEQTADKGTMYYIYNKDDERDMYHVCMCDKENSHKVIKIQGNELPEGAGVDSVLRIKNEEYILDKVGTSKVNEKMEKMVQHLLEEQTQKMDERRIDGHLYEVVEISSKNVTLLDITKDLNNGDCFEELAFSKENIQNAKEGDVLKYINGEYIRSN